ncbi:MAG: hypothetical protein Q8921_07680 [Bacteroidota bacterium]|nr:hypothetical protein [Bacteroidota bacterium]
MDILGFQSLVPHDNEGADRLATALLAAQGIFAPLRAAGETKRNAGRTVTHFSDSIVLSFKENEKSGVYYNLLLILHLHIRLIELDILVRGGIAIGKVVHNGNLLFGPAMNDAYLLEKNAALYPRIIVTPDIFSLARKHHADHLNSADEEMAVHDIVKKDADGMFYIDYFDGAASEVEHNTFYGYKLREIIRLGLNSNRVDLQVKYMWMREKFNDSIWVIRFKLPPL